MSGATDRATPAPQRFGAVAVLMGGHSAEREISLRSGQAVLAGLRNLGIRSEAIDTGKPWIHRLSAFDRAFIALHGRGGEDGAVQGVLETVGMPYTGSGVLACALSMDKFRTKQVWQAEGVPTPAYARLDSEADLPLAQAELGLPLVVKPAREGSSLGMSKVSRPEDLRDAFAHARRFDARVIAEAWVQGEEYTAAILDQTVLPLIRLETDRTFYDYEAKYHSVTTKYHCPSGLSAADEARFGALSLRAFEAVDGRGWGRVDFMVDGDGRPWVLEINAVPGLTDHSLVPMAAAAIGLSFDQLVARILATSIAAEEGL